MPSWLNKPAPGPLHCSLRSNYQPSLGRGRKEQGTVCGDRPAHHTSSSSSSSGGVGFLGLPLELRELVYQHFYADFLAWNHSYSFVLYWCDAGAGDAGCFRCNVAGHAHDALPKVCRQLHQELFLYYLAHADFRLQTCMHRGPRQGCLAAALPAASLACLRILTIDFQHWELLRPAVHGARSVTISTAFLAQLQAMRQLDHLTVLFHFGLDDDMLTQMPQLVRLARTLPTTRRLDLLYVQYDFWTPSFDAVRDKVRAMAEPGRRLELSRPLSSLLLVRCELG